MANFNLNKVILGGRLTKDPELRKTQNGVSVVQFTVAVNRSYKSSDQQQSQADFITVVAWRATAEFVAKYFHKGSSICVLGSIQTRTYKDKNGNNAYATEVIADEVNFVDSKSDSGSRQNEVSDYVPQSYGGPAYSSDSSDAPKFDESMSSDDDLPF